MEPVTARNRRLRFVDTGNAPDANGGSESCRCCGRLLVGRRGHEFTARHLDGCGARLDGGFEGAPGPWGARRVPVRMRR